MESAGGARRAEKSARGAVAARCTRRREGSGRADDNAREKRSSEEGSEFNARRKLCVE